MVTKYKELKIEPGDYICIINHKGEGVDGNLEEKLSDESFMFFNNTTGRSEVVDVNSLQDISKP